MDVPHAHSGMEIIPRKECLRLLAGRNVGRLGFLVGDQPMVLPVNYVLRRDVVSFRTGEGTKLDATPRAKVAFEVDEVDVKHGTGWSVVVQGVAEEMIGAEDRCEGEIQAADVPTWLPGPADHLMRSGQR